MSEVNTESKVYVATYGSLRRAMQNYRVNERAGGKFVGKGSTADNVDLFRFGGSYFPSVSLVHSESGKPVVVDVFETTVDGLTGPYDMLEGYSENEHTRFYNRSEIVINMDDGNQIRAYIYHIDEEQPERVESGDWCLHNNPNYYETLKGEEE